MAEKMISEILAANCKLKTNKEKVQHLKTNDCRPLRNILKGLFDEAVVFNLPAGIPPYRKDDAPKGYEISNLHRVSKRFKYFDKGGIGEQMLAARREKMFIDVLESLHPDEAELVIAMKEKSLMGKYKGITSKLVSEAFPNLLVKPIVATRAKSTKVKKKAVDKGTETQD